MKKKMAEEFLNQISAKCSVIIIGAGQAGLSIAHSLQKKGIKPLILEKNYVGFSWNCLLYTSPSPRDGTSSRMPSSA